MFKRVRWTLFGALLGAGGSMWARRRVRRKLERYLPAQLGTEARQRLSIAGEDLRAALDEGRAAMAEREAELRSAFADRMIAQPVRPGRIIDAHPPSLSGDTKASPVRSNGDAKASRVAANGDFERP